MRAQRTWVFLLMALAVLPAVCLHSHTQVAMLMEEPYGFFGAVNPTGHDAVYFQRICAETSIKLRRCAPSEPGAVITRYQGIAGYDWLAMPLIPYLYAVENASEVPVHVNREIVISLRERYHDDHLLSLGKGRARGRPGAERLEPVGGRGIRAPHLCLSVCHHRTAR